jgi:hypothetical protein
MKHHRAFGLALSLMCLLAAPRTFAGSSDKDKDAKKKEPTKQSTPAPKTHAAPPTSSQSGGSHGSSGQSHSSHGTSDSADASKTEHSAHETSRNDSKHTHSSGETSAGDSSHVHSATSASDSSHAHSAHESSGSASHHSNDSHDRTVTNHEARSVNHVQLHEAMSVHPGRQEREHALERSRVEQALFERHRTPIRFLPAHRVVLTGLHIVPATYHYRRTVFYDAYSWRAPVYVYRMYPRYGLWDAVFLAFALDHLAEEQYALMLYHHQHDAEIQQWLEDSDRLAADNDDLRAKLENMKLEMARLEESGVVIDPSYVPIDARDVALSPEVIDQLTSK